MRRREDNEKHIGRIDKREELILAEVREVLGMGALDPLQVDVHGNICDWLLVE